MVFSPYTPTDCEAVMIAPANVLVWILVTVAVVLLILLAVGVIHA